MKQAALADTDTSEIVFAEGIIGVPRARRFQLLERPGTAVRLLRCLDIEGFVLPVVDPYLADAGYKPELTPRVSEALSLRDGDGVLFLAIATLSEDGPKANLRAPLVINTARRTGAQVILDKPDYGLQIPLRRDG